ERDGTAGVRVRGEAAVAAHRAHGDDATAVRRAGRSGRACVVAGPRDDRDVLAHGERDRRGEVRVAVSGRARRETEVYDVGRVEVVGNVGNGNAHGPQDRVGGV